MVAIAANDLVLDRDHVNRPRADGGGLSPGLRPEGPFRHSGMARPGGARRGLWWGDLAGAALPRDRVAAATLGTLHLLPPGTLPRRDDRDRPRRLAGDLAVPLLGFARSGGG